MSPLAILALGLVANVVAVAVTHALAPDWQVTAASIISFIGGAAYERARMRPRLESLEAALTTSGRRR